MNIISSGNPNNLITHRIRYVQAQYMMAVLVVAMRVVGYTIGALRVWECGCDRHVVTRVSGHVREECRSNVWGIRGGCVCYIDGFARVRGTRC